MIYKNVLTKALMNAYLYVILGKILRFKPITYQPSDSTTRFKRIRSCSSTALSWIDLW